MARYTSLDPEKKDKIKMAALDLFFENGIQNTTVAQIAKRAGIAKGTTYLYFKNREEIEECVLEYCSIRNLEYSMRGVDKEITYTDKLKKRTRNILDFTANFRRESKVLNNFYKPVNVGGTVETPFAKSYKINENFIKLGIESGEFKDLPLELITKIYFSGVEGFCTFFNASKEMYEDKQLIEQALDALMDLIRK